MKFLPCPFCGSTDCIVDMLGINECFVRCKHCRSWGPIVPVASTGSCIDTISAANAWNRRHDT